MILAAQYFKDLFLDLLFPKFCFGCSKEGYFLCQDCADRLQFLDPAARPLCVFNYHLAIIRELVYAFKYDQLKSLDQTLSQLMHAFLLANHFKFDQTWSVSYVPMHPKKQAIRGFNQAELLARQLAFKLNLPVLPVLLKIQNTRPQMQLNRGERSKNLENAFAPVGNLHGKKIILIDDVCTTGATFAECQKILFRAGAGRILCFAFAKDI